MLRAVIAIFSLAAGASLGCWYSSLTSAPHLASSLGINTNTPIPRHIFTNRKQVAFIPHPEFMGPSPEADDNWTNLTTGTHPLSKPNHSPI